MYNLFAFSKLIIPIQGKLSFLHVFFSPPVFYFSPPPLLLHLPAVFVYIYGLCTAGQSVCKKKKKHPNKRAYFLPQALKFWLWSH